jgi:uncharacterized membrane protein
MSERKNIKANEENNDRRAAKKVAVLGNGKRGRFPVLIAALSVALIAGGGIFVMAQRGEKEPIAASPSEGRVSADTVIYDKTLFDDGKARYFSHAASDGITVKYFILKSSDGVIRAAFDACDVCWRAGKGYAQQGDTMVCRNCGRRFASVLVNEVKGGCNPAPLARAVEGDTVIIRIADILEGKQYFNFSGRAAS